MHIIMLSDKNLPPSFHTMELLEKHKLRKNMKSKDIKMLIVIYFRVGLWIILNNLFFTPLYVLLIKLQRLL